MLPLARVVCAGLPVMDAPLLTAFVDRWRPETHSFHLPCGEVSITMQDVAMILGLPLEGNVVIGMIQTDGWRDMVEAHIGIRPPEPPEGVKDRKTSGVSSAWLKQNFNHCPQGAPQEAVERYARVWLWHLLGASCFLMVPGTLSHGWSFQFWDISGRTSLNTAGVGSTNLALPAAL